MSSKKRVLIADDSNFMRNSLKAILEKCQCEVVGEAANGAEVVTKYKELHPDLVTLDVIMPQMNGFETLKVLKSIDPAANVIMVTSLSSKEDVTNCINLGAKYYLVKPFDEAKVMETVMKVIA